MPRFSHKTVRAGAAGAHACSRSGITTSRWERASRATSRAHTAARDRESRCVCGSAGVPVKASARSRCPACICSWKAWRTTTSGERRVGKVWRSRWTTQFHGALFEFVRNDAFDARPYPFTSATPTKAPFKWNQFGFTLGGPVKIPHVVNGANKLFFMTNYEGFRLRNQQQVVYSTPPAAMRGGDFSRAPVVIRDPLTNTPFPGNIIPANRLNPIAIQLLEFYPEPNITGT